MMSLSEKINLLRKIALIQGGMGVGVSGHRLARRVSVAGQLGVISATAPDLLLIRGLQDGDMNGELRYALSQFPNQEVAAQLYDTFFIPGGKDPDQPYKSKWFPQFMMTGDNELMLKPQDRGPQLEDALVAGAFVETFLAKHYHDMEPHGNPIGANFLNKIEWAQLPTLYGAMLAGIDVALIGAGFAKGIPEVLSEFTEHQRATIPISISDASQKYRIAFDPSKYASNKPLERPVFLGIVGNHLGARGISTADGYIFEGPIAGGHNPPARVKGLSEHGEPLYSPEDDMDFDRLPRLLRTENGQKPYWLAGNYATRLEEAKANGACGVQVGTPFAYCQESGIDPALKRRALEAILAGASVFTDPRASPTGFPFKVLQLDGTVGVPEGYAARPRKCDLGYLIELYEHTTMKDGEPRTHILPRCPSEPIDIYLAKGGTLEETEGRMCLCNALAGTIGNGQTRKKPHFYREQPLVTSGADFTAVRALVAKHGPRYHAEDVVRYILRNAA
jgi:nitronate monooxygenase